MVNFGLLAAEIVSSWQRYWTAL